MFYAHRCYNHSEDIDINCCCSDAKKSYSYLNGQIKKNMINIRLGLSIRFKKRKKKKEDRFDLKGRTNTRSVIFRLFVITSPAHATLRPLGLYCHRAKLNSVKECNECCCR